MVPAGSGKVYVNAETIGSRYLLVKVGNKAAASFKLSGRETVEIPIPWLNLHTSISMEVTLTLHRQELRAWQKPMMIA
jgi:hypothetical protein